MEALHKAIKEGDVDAVQALVENGENINSLFGLQGTPLCAAVQANTLGIVEALLEAGCDLNAKDYDGEPPLCLAIRKGRDDIVRRLIAAPGCDLNQVDPVSLSAPLGVAVTEGQTRMAEWLLKSGCQVNKQGKDYNTALHQAVLKRNVDAMRVILEDGECKMNISNCNGKSALHLCVEQEDILTLSVLLSMCSLKQGDNETCGDYELNLDQPSIIDGNTALHIAIIQGHFEAAELLMDAGCSVDVPNSRGQTALHAACLSNHSGMLMSLLKAGANPNAKVIRTNSFHVIASRTASSPIHLAIERGNLDMVQVLVQAGADVNSENAGGGEREGYSPLTQALWTNKVEIAKYLLGIAKENLISFDRCSNSRKNNPLFAVSSCDSVRELTQSLIDLGCSVNADCKGERPLQCAVEMDNTEVAEVLLDNGAFIEGQVDAENNLLHLCVLEEVSEDMVHLLVFYGIDMHALASNGDSLAQLALEGCNVQYVSLLVKCGYKLSREAYLQPGCPMGLLPACLEEDAVLLEWLRNQAAMPHTLSVQCRTALRTHFLSHGITMKKMRGLPLPRKLLDFVMLKVL